MRPALIDEMSWEMAQVYEAVTDRILVNMAAYFPYVKQGGEPKDLFEYQARMLAQIGQLNRETVDIIAGSLSGGNAALRAVLEAAIRDALKNEEPKLRKAVEQGMLRGPGIAPPEMTANQTQAFRYYYTQAADKLNLVNTVMLESTENAYRATVSDITNRMQYAQHAVDTAAGEVITGVSSWNQAMHDAVAKMVDNGITGFVDHGGHKWRPETYVAMDIRSTMFNAAREATWELNEQYGNDLYLVSTHNGARPLCYPWQAKVISRTDMARDVTDLYGNTVHVYAQRETSYGQPAGLFGVNCRHYPKTFVPGFSRMSGDPQPPEENAEVYAQSQQQRELERKLRKEKLDLDVLKAQGATPDEIKAQRARVSAASAELESFCEETGRARRRNREYTPVNATWPDDPKPSPKGGGGDNPPINIHLGPDNIPPAAQAQTPVEIAAPEPEPQIEQPQLGPAHFEYAPAKSIEEAEAFAREHFLYSDKSGSVSYSNIDLEYANKCNNVLNDVFEQYTPKYKLSKLGPMNAREKIFKSAIESSEACYHWAGEGGMYYNPRFYKNKKTFAAHKAQIDDLTEQVLSGGQKLIDSGKFTGQKLTYIETLLRTKRQCVSQSHDFVEGTFVHESGHMLDDKIFRKVMKETDSPLGKFGGLGDSRRKYGPNISGYAVSTDQEYIAESFTAWWYGETDILDPEVVYIFEEAKKYGK